MSRRKKKRHEGHTDGCKVWSLTAFWDRETDLFIWQKPADSFGLGRQRDVIPSRSQRSSMNISDSALKELARKHWGLRAEIGHVPLFYVLPRLSSASPKLSSSWVLLNLSGSAKYLWRALQSMKSFYIHCLINPMQWKSIPILSSGNLNGSEGQN